MKRLYSFCLNSSQDFTVLHLIPSVRFLSSAITISENDIMIEERGVGGEVGCWGMGGCVFDLFFMPVKYMYLFWVKINEY
jgi:hypothetical protein